MKYREDMELDTTMDAAVDVVVDAAVGEHTLDVDVDVDADADVVSNAEAGNTATHAVTAHIPSQSVKLPAQSTNLQQNL